MKTISVRDLQKKVRECVEAAQGDRVVITRRGKPAAVLVGVEGADWETVVQETNTAFWRLIQKRRKQPTVSMANMRKQVTKTGKRRQALLSRAQPFLKLMGKGKDSARDVSRNKYKYLGQSPARK